MLFKRPTTAWFTLLWLLLLSGGCTKSPPPLPPLGQDAVILAFGDSITHGTGASRDESYPAVLEQLSGRTVYNEGVPGEVTAEGLQRLPRTLEELQPDLVLLCLGGNDMLKRKGLATAKQNLAQMIKMIQGEGISVVLLGVPAPAIFGLESAEIYPELAEEYNIPLVDEVIPDVLDDNEFKSDPIHPNAKGYRRIAEEVFALLQETGAL